MCEKERRDRRRDKNGRDGCKRGMAQSARWRLQSGLDRLHVACRRAFECRWRVDVTKGRVGQSRGHALGGVFSELIVRSSPCPGTPMSA